MSRILLCYLRILLLINISSALTFFRPHHRLRTASLEFTEGLHNRGYASHFTAGTRMISRTKVVLANAITPSMCVVTSEGNTYPLFDLLHYIYDYRSSHVTILEFNNRSALRSAQWTLKYFNRNWIWVQVAMLKGPNGAEPTLHADQLQTEYKLASAQHVWLVYEMTTTATKPYGYTAAHLAQLKKYAFAGSFAKIKGVMVLDILHASHTTMLPDKIIKDKMEYVIFKEINGTRVADINFDGLHRIIGVLGIGRVYLDVSKPLRMKIMEKYPDLPTDPEVVDKSGAAWNKGLIGVWLTLIRIYLLY